MDALMDELVDALYRETDRRRRHADKNLPCVGIACYFGAIVPSILIVVDFQPGSAFPRWFWVCVNIFLNLRLYSRM
ncbi:hypothetical protein QA641_36275 [Bradyrhizobium sp. CB1650]|uniref:hypothetical protein n=1 Tax=Bradyrhizobium sp. CB1650 TaxID=3039153 RepID=UPI0024348E89|nr:hypothetical protein [Bradyrhizobium sp. CB1650]WGD50979.1 hypothetical protein QA641_36275 [Bradyrhizobium sp. CB1650]